MSLEDYPPEVIAALKRDLGIQIASAEQRRREMDSRFCYGACCTWFGPIHETKINTAGLPGCPRCGGVLFEMDNEAEWWSGMDGFERGDPVLTNRPHPGYRAMWEWAQSQPKCFRDIGAVAKAYQAQTGTCVDFSK